MGRHVVVAPTEDAAEALGRANYAVWYANLTKLWRDFGAVPFRFAPRLRRGARSAGSPSRARPVAVREEIERQVAASGCTYLTCRLMFGEMSEAEAAANVDLFVAEVMPHVTALAVPA